MKYNPDKHGEVDIPELLSEQERDAVLLATTSVADFSEPGAAKTLTALQAAAIRRAQYINIVCPPSAVRMWLRTAAAFFGSDDVWFLEGVKESPKPTAKVIVVTYTRLLKEANRDYLFRRTNILPNNTPVHWILDEAHRLKTLTAKRTLYLYGKKAGVSGSLIAYAGRVTPLTGTPVVRHNDDVYPHLRALAPKRLLQAGFPSEEIFLSHFTHREMRQHHHRMRPKLTVVGSRNTKELEALLYGGPQPFAVRRLVSDLTTMPPITFTRVDVEYESTPELTEATRAIDAPELFEQDGIPAAATVRRMLGAAKAKSVAQFAVEQHEDTGRPCLILYWHKETADRLVEALQPYGATARMGGETSANKKSEIEDKFNEGKIDFLIGQIASMGESLNLQQGGNTAIFAEPDWSPSAIEQAFRRLWRYGQEHHVRVLLCYANHPADAGAERVLQRKAHNMDLLSPSATAIARKGLL